MKAKFELKYNSHYKDLGKVPGIVVEENKRRKIVKELGGEMRGEKPLTKVTTENIEEEKKEPMKEQDNEGIAMVS